MNRTPDFIGSWLVGDPKMGEFTFLFGGYGDFRMFIETREAIDRKRCRIVGTIED